MDDKPLVSVIIPTYNRKSVIKNAIDSVIYQTYSNLEIIIVDDCSTDETEYVISQIPDKRIRFIKMNKQSGACAARNKGVKYSKGNFIAFLDSDDIWKAEKLEKQIDIWKKNNWGDFILYTSYIYLKDEQSHTYPCSNLLKSEEPQDISQLLLIENFITTGTMLLKKKAFLDCCGFNEKYPRLQDWEFNIRLSKKYKHLFLKEELLIQHYSNISITSNVKNWTIARCMMLREHMMNYEDIGKVLFNILMNLKRFCQSNEEYDENLSLVSFELKSILSEYHNQGFLYKFFKNFLSLINLPPPNNINDIIIQKKIWGFPYHIIAPGSCIAIYGAGSVGKDYYLQISQNHYCQVKLWVDSAFESIKSKKMKVDKPTAILDMELDVILIAVSDNENYEEIKKYILDLGIPANKILVDNSILK